MNYVQHTRAVHQQLLAQAACRPHHVSLYMALFHQWNAQRFPAFLPINRSALMREAFIGSRATYTAALRDLQTWGFIAYYPTRDHVRGTQVRMHELGAGVGPQMGHCNATGWPENSPTPPRPDSPELVPPAGPDVGHVPPDVGSVVGQDSLLYKTGTSKPVLNRSTGAAAEKKIMQPVVMGLSGEEDAARVGKKSSPSSTAYSAGLRATPREVPSYRAAPDIAFSQSPIASLPAFCAAFAGTDYALADLPFYHELVSLWRDKKTGEAPRRKDWVATAKRFMLNDARDNSLKLAPGTHQAGADSHTPIPSTGYRSSRYD